jgi:N-acyl-D-aspartate/D-glutamate deacylase
VINCDLVIRCGTVIDGSGEPAVAADVAVNGGKIVAVQRGLRARGREELDASGLLVTPGFVDIHSHYDGQVTWDAQTLPSASHGVTTTVMGNCGVGFAPCRPVDRDALISLMEGVEDIPGTALAEGLPWSWESFPEYLNAVEARARDIDVAVLFPHGPLRVYVMGERSFAREPATAADIAAMQHILAAGLAAGAMGFSTSRTIAHRTSAGAHTPTFEAAAEEVRSLGRVLRDSPGSMFQMVSDFESLDDEFGLMDSIARSAGARCTFTLVQDRRKPDSWREQIERVERAQRQGLDIRGSTIARPVGMLMGFDTSLNPFSARPTYRMLASLPLRERTAQLRRPEVRQRILSESDEAPHIFITLFGKCFDLMFPLQTPVDYLPGSYSSVAARAAAEGKLPTDWIYDWFLREDGRSLVYLPLSHVPEQPGAIEEMLKHPHTIAALGDGGAHVGTICDASVTTFLLTQWVRERRALTIEQAIRMLTREPAEFYSLTDRGLLRPGLKADINLIDFDRLDVRLPRMVHDLPAGGRRFLQHADGYRATIVSGQIVQRDGDHTGALPGRLVRRSNVSAMYRN